MKKISSMVKVRAQASSKSNVNTGSAATPFIGGMGIASVAIGLWSVACLVSAVISGGPVGLVRGLSQALGII
ncbi:MAG: hypothetical protein OEV89_06720 [Desulfobulbaceae bacterium]|nr:hypothetical protein [Desulfobulbaceae bacterium]HIJ90445.1 hypothetical protein [Deltaproteobacteria bacterium]